MSSQKMRCATIPARSAAHQIFHHPVRTSDLKQVGRRAVLPDGVTDRRQRVRLQRRLRQQSGQKTAEHVARTALRQKRIAGRVHEDLSGVPADECLMAFQHHPAIAETLRQLRAQPAAGWPAPARSSC